MKRNFLKGTAIALSAVAVLGIGAKAAGTMEQDLPEKAEDQPRNTVISGTGVPCDKDETVYVLTDADGRKNQVIVSSWLKNTEKSPVLSDISNLQNIENVKGYEAFSADGSNLTWAADGNDICYQGTSMEELPVELNISCTLDGAPISPEELAGKSGRVTIRFDYTCRRKETVPVNGSRQEMNVPFVMLTGLILDSDIFRNVTVENGKLENLGERTVVAGLALPGMQENLAVSRDKLELPDHLLITADVTDFKLGPTLTLATTSLFAGIDPDDLSTESLKQQARKLTDGMNQLMDGSRLLHDGLSKLLEECGTLVDGVDRLAAGATHLQAGAEALNGGASQLRDGAAKLSEGLSMLDANSSTLNAGAGQVFNTLLSTAQTQLKAAGLDIPSLSIENYAEVLNGVIASLDENAVYQAALDQVTAGVQAKRSEIEAAVTQEVRRQVSAGAEEQVTAAVRQNVTEAVHAKENEFRAAVIFKATGMTPESYQAAVDAGLIGAEQQAAVDAAVSAAMDAAVQQQMETEEIKAKISGITLEKTDEIMKTDEISSTIAENTELQIRKAISDTMASPEIQQKLQAAAEGAKAVIGLKASLDSYNGFYLGLLAYTSGVSAASAGSQDLIAGADALTGGMSTLCDGVNTLHTGIDAMNAKTPELISGITQLKEGSGALQDGLATLMDEGIRKIADLAEDDLADLSGRLAASAELAKGYRSFSGADSRTESSVKFLFRTESVGTDS